LSIRDDSTCQVVGRDANIYSITKDNFDPVTSHASCKPGFDGETVFGSDDEVASSVNLCNGTFEG